MRSPLPIALSSLFASVLLLFAAPTPAFASSSGQPVALDTASTSDAATSDTPADTRVRLHELSLSAVQFSYFAFFRGTPTYTGADLSISRVFHPFGEKGALTGMPVVLAGGLRWAPGPARGLPFELYAAVRLRARFGPWEPTAGPELGYSGFTSLVSDRDYRPDDFFGLEQQRVSPLYLSFGISPARFVIGRFTVSAAELQVGATLAPPGGARRYHIGLLRLGWIL